MATMNVSAARDILPGVVETALTEVVFLEWYGRLAAAMAEEGSNVPWEWVTADLGRA